MRLISATIAIFITLALVAWTLLPASRIVLAQESSIPRGVVLEVAPNVYLYVEPEPIAVYRDDCGRVPIYHYILAPYSFLYSPYYKAMLEVFASSSWKGPRPYSEAQARFSVIRGVLDRIKEVLFNANIAHGGPRLLLDPVLEVRVSTRDLEKIMSIARKLSNIVSAHGLKLFIQVVPPEFEYNVDELVTWSQKHHEAMDKVLEEFGKRTGRKLAVSTGYTLGKPPFVQVFYMDDMGDLSIDQVIELGIELAKAVRSVSGCKLFAIEYGGSPPEVIPLSLVTTPAEVAEVPGEPVAGHELHAPIDYRPYLLVAVVVASAAVVGFFVVKTRRGLSA